MPTLSQGAKAALEDRIAQGVEATRLIGSNAKTCPTCGGGSNILRERTQQIIKESRDWFRQPASSKDDHVAVRFIAALAEVYDLEAALGYRAEAGARARATLHSDQTAEA